MSHTALDVDVRNPAHTTPDSTRADRRDRTRELLERLSRERDATCRRQLRERVTALNMGVADSIAHRYRDRGADEEDLEQVAYEGLSKAIARFDPAMGKDFLTYAVPTISGELKKYFRDCCWSVRPPRRIQELQHAISACEGPLSQRLNRAPWPQEIADELSVDAADVVEALSADGCFNPTSLDAPAGEHGGAESDPSSLGDLLGETDDDFSRAETHVLLKPLVRQLPERDRDMVALRFYHDWTQEQIAGEFGITQMQVSRLLTRIMRQLRDQVEDRS